MTDEPPAGERARRARPSRGMRATMLGREPEVVTTGAEPPASLAEALAAIPDLEREPATGAWSEVAAPPADHDGWSGNGSAADARQTQAATSLAPAPPTQPAERAVPGLDAGEPGPNGTAVGTGARVDDGAGDGADDGGRRRRRVPAEPRSVPWYRRALFALMIVLLVVAIPLLGWVGVKLIRDSKGGTYAATSTDPTQPGYEALVEPTPTALVVQRNADGTPNGLTFVGLGNTKGGGSVMFVPLDTNVLQPLPDVDVLREAYRPVNEPAKAQADLSRYTALTLGVGFSDTISIDNAGWEELLAKLAPIEIQNPDALTLGTVPLPVGAVQLQASQIGPYLEATVPGESDLNRLNRHEVLWRAIVAELAASNDPDILPGESNAGLGRYLRGLADGSTSYQTMPVTQDVDAPTFTIREPELRASMLQAVPFPQAPIEGSRPSVRVLDGVSANPRGTGLTQPLVKAGATIAAVGNGPEFGQETTTWTYSEVADKPAAVFLRQALGGKGTIEFDADGADVADVTVVVGKDLKDQLLAQSARDATTSTTSTTTPPAGAASSVPTSGEAGFAGG